MKIMRKKYWLVALALVGCSSGATPMAPATTHEGIDGTVAEPTPPDDGGCGTPAPTCVATGPLEVFAWGYNGFAQVSPIAMPDGSTFVAAPTPVHHLPANIVMLAAGDTHSLALDDQGNVWAWGANGCGELGVEPSDAATDTSCFWDEATPTASSPFQATPAKVQGLKGPVKAIAAGMMFSVAVLANGQVMTWGYNLAGTLGDGLSNYGPHATPQLVTIQTDAGVVPLSGVTSVHAGDYHVIAVTDDGKVWGWGSNNQGQLAVDDQGYGPSGVNGPYPVPPLVLDHVPAGATGVTAGGLHTYYLENGAAWGFGSYWNPGGANGGLLTTSNVPLEILGAGQLGASSVRKVASGGYFGSALANDGGVWFWGDAEANPAGSAAGSGPTRIGGLTSPIADIWAGSLTGFGLDTSGVLWSWGDNSYGELGVAVAPPTGGPVAVPGITGVTLFSTFSDHSLALAYACAAAAPLTTTITAPLPSKVTTFDGEECLPFPASTITGSAMGGTAPYTYAWTVTVLNADGTTRAGPLNIGSEATASTASIPGNVWSESLDQVAVESTGESVVFTLTTTDANNAQATASETVNWVCGPS
jgi:hypothetical protein